MRALAVSVFVSLMGCGGGESTSPAPLPSDRALRVTLATASDTIGAHLVGALQVSVTEGTSRPVALAAVTFTVLRDDRFPLPGIALSASGDTTVTVRTTSSGTAAIDVDLGKYAGTFAVVVTAQGIARADTATFTVQPGAVVSLRIPTQDTLVTVGASYKPLMFAADRAGNPPLNPPTLTSARPMCRVNGPTVTATEIARCIFIARIGAQTDSIAVNAIPRVPVTVVVGRSMATMNLDGTALKVIRSFSGAIFDPIHPAIGPGGLIAGIDVGGDGKTHVEIIDAAGSARFIPVDLPNGAEENWPVFSRDGQSLYFSACNWAYFEHCRVWQTNFDGSQVKILTPSTGSSGHRTNWTAVSPDGRMLAYAAYGERLHTLDLRTGKDVDLGILSDAFDFDSTGTKLVYVKDGFPLSPMFIANIDGSNPVAVASGRNFSGTAQWLPGGQWILSKSAFGAPTSGVLVNVTTGEVVPIRYSTPVSEIYIIR